MSALLSVLSVVVSLVKAFLASSGPPGYASMADFLKSAAVFGVTFLLAHVSDVTSYPVLISAAAALVKLLQAYAVGPKALPAK